MLPPYIAYGWRKPYLEAMAESEPKRLTIRIYKALAAIEQRKLSHVHQIEQHDMANAEEDIHRVIAAHFGRPLRGHLGKGPIG
jgi:hypothetical protein